ncbi:carbohydrate ABC transporter membrane protein 1 (CUT1 family) [Plasticicumulans lactativorans]|uniref:Carbohydrate ABC transporter membrane protein 1 (CUT1 family) n=2 Tax=Plasticicumulans lactativorans TaxID=1133106 RepID=A0A4R2LEI6_9GAMM|nr:carbohydrate ABC transporter membrane protein 1 (CUT1 family) [Plasticicumulans lactativorans]
MSEMALPTTDKRTKLRIANREFRQELGMLMPALVLLAIFLVVPFLLSFWFSLTNERLVPRPVPASFIGLQNFQRVLSDPSFWNSLWNVIRFTLMVLPIQCGFALLTAVLINQKLPFRNLFRSLLFLPAISSMVIVCVIWSTLYQFPTGPLNSLLQGLTFGLAGPVDWLGDSAWSMPALVLLSAWQAYGFQMIVYLAGLQNISPELYDAAKIDGANAWQRFWHITMPGLKQTHVFVILITTIQAFKLFTQVNILTQGGPDGRTDTVVHYMIHSGFVEQKVGYASAVSIILFVIVLAVSLVQRRLMRDAS